MLRNVKTNAHLVFILLILKTKSVVAFSLLIVVLLLGSPKTVS